MQYGIVAYAKIDYIECAKYFEFSVSVYIKRDGL